MLVLGIVAVVAFVAGFGVGRVKNAAKLAAVKAEVSAVEGKVTADFAAVVAKIKSVL